MLWNDLLLAAVTVTVDRNQIHVNESFQLYFEADSSVDSDPDFSPLQQHFEILNRSQSNNISIINGKYQRNLKWTLQLMPRQDGDFILPAIEFGNDKSERIRVTVKPASQSGATGSEGLVFELSGDDSSLYVQSQIVITLRLMSDSNISGYQMGDLAIEDMDVVIEALGDVKQYQTRIDEKPYLVLERQFALFPQQSGTLNIGPIRAEVQYGGRSRSIFDPFQSSNEIRRVSSNKITLEVLGKPDSFKAGHWFPSTDVQLDEEWQGDLNQLIAGEPVTRIISLKAEGLTAAQLPELVQTDVPGIKQYPDKPVIEDARSGKGISGLRQQRTAIIPTGAGRYTLPEIAIPWWNLETGEQEIASIPARIIEVQRAVDNNPAAEPSVEKLAANVDGSEIIPVLPSRPDRFWLWISAILAIGWIASILAWWYTRKGFSRQDTVPDGPLENNLRKAKKQLHRACDDNNAVAARIAILGWANAVTHDHQFVNLNQVTHYFGNTLKAQVDRLNQCIYSTDSDDWNGESLWNVCEQISAELMSSAEKSSPEGLLPLNP
jgi:hypothetical protein